MADIDGGRVERPGLEVDLTGRTAVVTGARAGIGRAIADAFVASGATVISVQRTEPDGLGDRFRFVPADLTDSDAVAGVVEQILGEHRVDILVNNAGVNIRHPFQQFPLDEWDQVLRVNLRAVAQLTQALGRPMLARGSGTVINIASMLSFTGGFTAAAYAASKGAVGQFTKSLANEWASQGVNVNAIAPGFIDTELNAPLRADEVRNRQILERIPAGRWGDPADIAGAALFLASGAARYVHGVILPVDGGYLAR
ncbi:SDR family oxidoreductase [Brooklawnia cerclae]|uniref:2-deoxy-D-gluconate 3-dehydrogenase n=1 Tax=Brooklawnia cerclae TaxID=349934 RepID=A0ABX0SH98_9ACTN|nr:SDR family oxidoreductase [Brooklawnia cerclae]NIH57769.1 2-deoxy-D-gluconate 3-dehydrogenase [Brooklawnia cerclae]